MTTLTEEQLVVGRSIREDPELFVREVLGERPYAKQIEMLRAIQTSRRVAVLGCTSSGKDWLAGRAILWWQMSRYPAKTVVTGPTSRQVVDVVWNEFRAAYRHSRIDPGGRLYGSPRWAADEQHFAVGFSFQDTPSGSEMPTGSGLQGYHSPNLLVVVTEAHAMKSIDIDTLKRLNPSCLVLTGNPFVSGGEFYDAFHSKRDLYATVEISAYDTPNLQAGAVVEPGMITAEDIEDLKNDWGEDSPLYVAGVLAKFPSNMGDTVVVPLDAALEATRRDGVTGDGRVILG